MNNRLVAVAAVILSGAVGCSDSAPEYQRPPTALPAATAQVSVGGQDVGTFSAVQCLTTQFVTTISTGDDASGTTSAVDAADGVTALFVKIRNLGGFTGDFWQGLDGRADADITGPMFTITGTATGYHTDSRVLGPNFLATENFEIKVSC